MSVRTTVRLLVLAAAAVAAAGTDPWTRASADPPVDPPPSGPDDALLRRLDAGLVADDDDGVRAWARETAEAGRTRPRTALGGDLLTAAAGALLGRGLDPAVALGHVKEAIATYPPGSAGLGLAWFHAANAFGWLGDPVAVLDALDRAEAIAKAPHPTGDSPRAERTWAEFQGRLRDAGPLHRARALTALARHAEAADVYEALATGSGGRGSLHAPDRMWREASLSAWRAGDRERAVRAGGRALEGAMRDEDVVDRTLWRLLASHGKLDDAGEVRLDSAWPGPGLAADARTAFRSVEGRRGAWRIPLQVASLAMLAREHDVALELYETAFLEPSFADEARASPFWRQTLVTAAHVALAAKRPREALRWLQAAERYAGGAIPDTTLLRAQIDEAFGALEPTPEARSGPLPRQPIGGDATSESPRTGRPGLGPPRGEGRPRGAGGDASAPDPAPGARPGVGTAAAVAAAVVAAVVLAAVLLRRRRRPRPPHPPHH